MTDILLIVVLALVAGLVVLQLLLLRKKVGIDLTPLEAALQSVERSYERLERSVRDEIAKNREEASTAARQSREELAGALKAVGDTINQQLATLTQTNDQKLASMRELIEQRLGVIQKEDGEKLDQIRQESAAATQKAREEVTAALKAFGELSTKNLTDMGANQHTQLASLVEQLTKLTEATEKKLETQRTAIDARLQQIQAEATASAKAMREDITNALKGFNDSVVKAMTGISDSQKAQLDKLTESNQQKLDALKTAVEEKLKALQEDNTKQLDQMRATVDEKLHSTLEKRLGESFKLVSERLEQVYKGLGEMQTLATGVGDLKKVLTNVKTRGTWGEVQLGALLEQVLSPEQYEANVAPKDEGERVEFAVKMPGRSGNIEEVVWLPIDAKFPVEDYQRLVEAQEKADPVAAEEAASQLEVRIKQCAKDICDKYINPPKTTDFGILFLPTEGLFAEVIRRTGLPEYVQSKCRVVVAGPTTLWSILSSLQMGFRTLAIQKRSSEVWNLLAAVKTEWTKYGEVLGKVQKKLQEATNTVDDAAKRTRAIGRKLRDVQELPATDAGAVLMLEGEGVVSDDGDVMPPDVPAPEQIGSR